MKIAIIGGGWVGCHLAKKLMSDHKVKIFEKNKNLFEESSYKNQNRLHLGYHYARSSKTRKLCKNTFQKFIDEYSFLVSEVKTNLYCVPYKKSLMDFETFTKIFDDYDHEEFTSNTLKVEGCVNTYEKHINFKKAKKYFNTILKKNFTQKEISSDDLTILKKEYDLVLNCTNNFIRNNSDKESFYELTISFLYEKINETEFDALTLVDGPLFSIYPYTENIYTVTDVELTPIKKFSSIEDLENYLTSLNELDKTKIKESIENRIELFYPNFTKDFKHKDHFISVKSKFPNDSDDRSPVILVEEKMVNIFTGKIQGIYLIEDFIKNLIDNG